MHMEASLGRAVLLAAFPPPTLGEFPPKRLLTPGRAIPAAASVRAARRRKGDQRVKAEPWESGKMVIWGPEAALRADVL